MSILRGTLSHKTLSATFSLLHANFALEKKRHPKSTQINNCEFFRKVPCKNAPKNSILNLSYYLQLRCTDSSTTRQRLRQEIRGRHLAHLIISIAPYVPLHELPQRPQQPRECLRIQRRDLQFWYIRVNRAAHSAHRRCSRLKLEERKFCNKTKDVKSDAGTMKAEERPDLRNNRPGSSPRRLSLRLPLTS